MGLLKELSELIQAGVISQETADKIQLYYSDKKSGSSNRLFLVFGVLGSILIGLGIILIMAHNWDKFPRSIKTIFAFLPLIFGQALCLYTLLRKEDSQTWRESSSAFLFFAVGACISLISQIYHIPGNLSSFLLIWMLLCLPLVYIMRSSIVSLLYLAGITYYACETNYWQRTDSGNYYYWFLWLLVLPHYYSLYKERSTSNSMNFHNWFLPMSIVIALGTFTRDHGEWMFVAYFSLFGFLYGIGSHEFFRGKSLRSNAYRIISALGTLVLLLTLSFEWFWDELRGLEYVGNELYFSGEFWVSSLLFILASLALYINMRSKSIDELKPLSLVFILFLFTFLLGMISSISIGLINLYVILIGVLTIREGSNSDHLGILNYGLMIITALVICRFFDTDLSFVIRGFLFVMVGIGFFVMNYRMLQKRKSNG